MEFSIVQLGTLEVCLWLHTKRDPSQEAWDAAGEELKKLKERVGGDIQRMPMLVITDGGAPNARQRSQLERGIFGGGKHRTAAISNMLSNPVIRGLATALSWLNPGFRVFEPSHWREAVDYIGVPDGVRRLWPALKRMQAKLPPVTTLRVLANEAELPRQSTPPGPSTPATQRR
jgi:hypothetical protein